jgi:hypothetical protein
VILTHHPPRVTYEVRIGSQRAERKPRLIVRHDDLKGSVCRSASRPVIGAGGTTAQDGSIIDNTYTDNLTWQHGETTLASSALSHTAETLPTIPTRVQ